MEKEYYVIHRKDMTGPICLTPQEAEDVYYFQQGVFAAQTARERIDDYLELNDVDPDYLPDDFGKWADGIAPELGKRFLADQSADQSDNTTWDCVMETAMSKYLSEHWTERILELGKRGTLDYPSLMHDINVNPDTQMESLSRDDFLDREDEIRNALLKCYFLRLANYLEPYGEGNDACDPDDFDYVHTFLVQRLHGIEIRSMYHSFRTRHENPEDLMDAIRAACLEHCRTPDGKRAYALYDHKFGIENLYNRVPMETCAKHGFISLGMTEPIVLNADTQLVDASDVYGDDNQ